MSQFIGDVIVKLVADDESGIWELITPFSFQSDIAGQTFTAPKGFQTDFCSVPRLPIAYAMLGDRARKAGIIHDWLYTSHVVNRAVADHVLYEMLLIDGVDKVEATSFYLAVRAGGGSHWGPDPAVK